MAEIFFNKTKTRSWLTNNSYIKKAGCVYFATDGGIFIGQSNGTAKEIGLPTAELAEGTSTPYYEAITKLSQGLTSNGSTITADQLVTILTSLDDEKADIEYVDNAIATLPEPMIFKGSLGTGGTITSLPTAGSSNEGFTYKVITAGTYAGQSAKVGDTFICAKKNSSTYEWVLIPSGDEPNGTVTSVGLETGDSGLLIQGDHNPITASGTFYIGIKSSHKLPTTEEWDDKYEKPTDGIPARDLDESLRQSLRIRVEGTKHQVSGDAVWNGTIPGLTSLTEGLVIDFVVPKTTGTVTLKIHGNNYHSPNINVVPLNNNIQLDASHFMGGTVLTLTYTEKLKIDDTGDLYTAWVAQVYDDRTLYWDDDNEQDDD